MHGVNIERAGRVTPIAELCGGEARRFSEPPKVAVVVGTFAAVPYVHLHLEARRRFYPEVPLLVHDDGSPKSAELCTGAKALRRSAFRKTMYPRSLSRSPAAIAPTT